MWIINCQKDVRIAIIRYILDIDISYLIQFKALLKLLKSYSPIVKYPFEMDIQTTIEISVKKGYYFGLLIYGL